MNGARAQPLARSSWVGADLGAVLAATDPVERGLDLIANVAPAFWQPPSSAPEIGGQQRNHKNNAYRLGVSSWHKQWGARRQDKESEDLIGR